MAAIPPRNGPVSAPAAKAAPKPASAPAQAPQEAPTPARPDAFQSGAKPENWKIQATSLDAMYEKVKAAQHEAGQRVAEDLTETNLDTGEVHRLHAEERVEADRHTIRQELGIYDPGGTLRSHMVSTSEDDGHGHVRGHEETTTFKPTGEAESHTTTDWETQHGQTVRDVTVTE